MGNINVNRTGGNPLDSLDNPVNSELLDYVTATREYHPPSEPRPDWRQTAAVGAVVVVLLVVGWLGFSLWKLGYCWSETNYSRCQRISDAEPIGVLIALTVAFGVTFAPWLMDAAATFRLKSARAVRTLATFDRFGDPQRLDLLPSLAEQSARYRLATQLKTHTAQFEQLHSVNSLSPSIHYQNSNTGASAGALTAPEAGGIAPVLPDDWLEWLMDTESTPQALIIGKTRSGKSTLADVVLARRAERGDRLAIIDIHWSTEDAHGAPKWGAVPPLARTVEEAHAALVSLKAEYEDRKRRMQLPASDPAFVRETCFEPITILVDEAPELSAEIEARQRGLWDATIKFFGSGGAKVNMFVLLLSQSPNTDDVGLNAAMRENFATFALANTARPFIQRYERDKDRRMELYTALDRLSEPGMKPAELPIVADRNGQVQVLSRTGLLAHRLAHIDAEIWTRPSVREDAPNTPNTALSSGRTDDTLREALIVGLKKQGKNREEIRGNLQTMGLGFENAEYAEIMKRYKLSGK